ncbi:polyprenyl synthetase family protein [Streptomyces johnsoniae]|uniref:Polyprenyl synthetase family protein n=1 Tax=Streptomyces johnsoniae TaxID=3075532 RepID=A0ABU2S474_9ACTN|nr:polyprenyl synthetase family protein [Streptomyces sp. DSM 41886]MDT0442850.1 polyprenyl synthetase family protein [Streptomyces sp. DSM 41886]
MTTVPETTGEHHTALGTLRQARELLDPALRTWVHRLPAPVARVASYHFGWTDSSGRPDSAPAGKALRPALVFGCAEAVGARPEEAVAPAVAVELVHNFSLLHDDILDGDTTRRHRATAWTVFGNSAALLAGDALLIHAGRVLTEQPAGLATVTGIRWLSEATTQLIEGEHTDISFEERSHVSLAECLAMTERKTAALLACSCALGALWGGGAPERTEALRRFGTHLGMAFQLTDDLLGIWGDPAVTGKPAGADLASRKKSLPVVAALDSGTPAARRLAELYLPDAGAPAAARTAGAAVEDPELTARIAALVEEAGGRSWAEKAAEEELRLALGCLDLARPEGGAGERLAALARLACHRDR